MPSKYQSRKNANITSITYWRRFAEHRLMYVLLAGIFAFGIVAYFGTGPMGGRGSSDAERRRQSFQSIVTVNGDPVPRSQYDRTWERVRRGGGGSDLQSLGLQGMILHNLVETAIARSAAKKQGFVVTDADVDRALNEQKAQLGRGKPVSDAEFEAMLDAQGLSMVDLRESMKEDLLPRMLQDSLAKNAKATEEDLLKSYDEYKIRHILVSTGKLPEGQAKAKAEKILAEVKSGKDFAELANKYTDDPGNKSTKWDPKLKKSVDAGPPKGGDMGWKPLSTYVKEFADAARALKKGETSGLVKSQFGYHIIKLDDVRRTLPKDYAKDKAKLIDDFRKQKGRDAFMELMEKERKTAKIEWNDPSMEWRYDMGSQGGMFGMQGGMQGGEAIVAKLRAYVPKHPEDGVAALALGQKVYPQYIMAPPGPAKDKTRDEVIQYYEAGLKRAEDQQTRLTLAQLYRDAKQNDNALKQYVRVQNQLKWSSGTETKYVHVQLEKAFRELGQPELATKETVKIAQLSAAEKKEADEQKKQQEAEKKAKEEAEKKAKAATPAPGAKPGAPAISSTRPTSIGAPPAVNIPIPGGGPKPGPEPDKRKTP